MSIAKDVIVTDQLLVKLNLFYNETNLYKFSLIEAATFSDGKSMRTFWMAYANFIKGSDLQICKQITEQYNNEFLAMMKQRVDKNYKFHINSFFEEKNMNKFNRNIAVKFSDGTNMGDFWNVNKKSIMESKDETCVKICRQYAHYEFLVKRKVKEQPKKNKERKEYLKNKSIISKASTKTYEYRLEAFAKIEDLSKFTYNNDGLIFSDGTKVTSFWRMFYKYILESDNELCIKIQEQYKQYKKNKTISKEEESKQIFDKRAEWFYELEMGKFSSSSTYKFSDGTSAYSWWKKHFNDVLSSNDDMCNNIMNQYEDYIILIDNIKNSGNNYTDDEKFNYINRLN